jgi:putative transposase
MTARLIQTSPSDWLYVSHETGRKLFTELDQYALTQGRWGTRVANRTREPRGAGVLVHRPLERTEIDHFHVDIHLVDDEGEPAGRPYLSVIIDCYSRMVLGYTLSLKTPNAMTVLATIRHAIYPKPAIDIDRQALGFSLEDLPIEKELRWEVAGIMSQVIMDNGGDFMSLSVRTGLDEFGIEVQFCPPKEPWYKAIIERFGRTMNMRLIHWLPGTTYGKVMRDNEYDARDHACLTLDELRQRIELGFWAYNRLPHRGIKRRSPLEVWREGVAQWPILLPPENSLRHTASLLLTDERTLHKYGIEFDSENFNSDELGALWNRMPNRSKVMIKINPEDLNYIYLIDPSNDQAFKVPNLKPRSVPTSWAIKELAKKRGKALGLDPQENEAELAQNAMRASRRMLGKKHKPKKPSPARPTQKKSTEQPENTLPQAQTPSGAPDDFDPDALFASDSED